MKNKRRYYNFWLSLSFGSCLALAFFYFHSWEHHDSDEFVVVTTLNQVLIFVMVVLGFIYK